MKKLILIIALLLFSKNYSFDESLGSSGKIVTYTINNKIESEVFENAKEKAIQQIYKKFPFYNAAMCLMNHNKKLNESIQFNVIKRFISLWATQMVLYPWSSLDDFVPLNKRVAHYILTGEDLEVAHESLNKDEQAIFNNELSANLKITINVVLADKPKSKL